MSYFPYEEEVQGPAPICTSFYPSQTPTQSLAMRWSINLDKLLIASLSQYTIVMIPLVKPSLMDSQLDDKGEK